MYQGLEETKHRMFLVHKVLLTKTVRVELETGQFFSKSLKGDFLYKKMRLSFTDPHPEEGMGLVLVQSEASNGVYHSSYKLRMLGRAG